MTLLSILSRIDELKSELRKAEQQLAQEKRLYCNERGITFLRDEQLRNEILGDAACAAALRPFGLSQSSLSQAEPAPAIAGER